MPDRGFALSVPDALVEAIAERAAELVADRLAERESGYLDVEGAAVFLSCGVSRVYALTRARRIPFEREVGGCCRPHRASRVGPPRRGAAAGRSAVTRCPPLAHLPSIPHRHGRFGVSREDGRRGST